MVRVAPAPRVTPAKLTETLPEECAVGEGTAATPTPAPCVAAGVGLCNPCAAALASQVRRGNPHANPQQKQMDIAEDQALSTRT